MRVVRGTSRNHIRNALNNYFWPNSVTQYDDLNCFIPCRPTVNEKCLSTPVTPPSLSVLLLYSGQIWSFVRLAKTPSCSKRWRKFQGFLLVFALQLWGDFTDCDFESVLLAISLCQLVVVINLFNRWKCFTWLKFPRKHFYNRFGWQRLSNIEQCIYQVKQVRSLTKRSSYLSFQEQSSQLWFAFWNCTGGATLLHARVVHWSADVPITVSTF